MKNILNAGRFVPGWAASAAASFFFLTTALAGPVPSNKPSYYPAWWFERDVIKRINPNTTNPMFGPGYNDYPATDDFAVITQGQLKYMALKGYEEMQARLPASIWQTPEGQALAAAVNWTPGLSDDYAVTNQAQAKTLAMKFYDVLKIVGYTSQYPWPASSSSADPYAVTNIGQAKKLFSFDLAAFVAQLPQWWIDQYFPGQTGILPTGDNDADGATNLQEYQAGTNPTVKNNPLLKLQVEVIVR